MQEITIATWNVNSVRARFGHLCDWLKAHNPTVLLMQEIKCQDEFFPALELSCMGYNTIVKGQKSYNGVAIISKIPLEASINHLPCIDTEFSTDSEARYIEATISVKGKIIRIASVYVPNGNSTLQKGETLEQSYRFRYKLDFFARLRSRFQVMNSYQKEYFVAGGDYNVARSEIDLYNPKEAAGDVGFHDAEREALEQLFNCKAIDCFRLQYPKDQTYSWWNYRGNAWAMNKGWRIDYLLGSENLQDIMQECSIHTQQRGYECASDHAPVLVKLKL
jgi:exodeoxyribonuclease III